MIRSSTWRASIASIIVAVVQLAWVASAAADFRVLTVGKAAWFVNRGDPARSGGIVTVGPDRALRRILQPTCPSTSGVEVEAYLQSTFRDAVLAHVELDCSKWFALRDGYAYDDPNGTVRSIRYGRAGLRIEVGGPGFTPIGGPVGFLQAQLTIGGDTLRARFHNFRRNDGQVVRSRRPSEAAARGEAGFWDAILGEASSEADEQKVIDLLETAVTQRPRDGRSHFLLAMIHLYRFGQRVVRFDEVSDAARAELAAANESFVAAVPLLWDGASGTGDSRVPGFAAAAKYMRGVVEDDAQLRASGLADLDESIRVNSFFNVFDYIPVLQALPPGDPLFAQGFALFSTYLNDPETLACVVTQPELCANAGFAPRNVQGALTLFGDLYAKAGDLAQATSWYTLAKAFSDSTGWAFASAIEDRVANAAERVALYADADPTNDPPIIGAGPEACAVCHVR